MPIYRADQHLIHLSVNGVALDNVQWDKFDGGDLKAASTPHLPGGMAPQVELGGIPQRSAITLNRGWSDALIAAFKSLDAAAGHTPATVSATTLDGGGHPTGDTVTYTGVLLEVSRPNYDSKGTGAAELQVVIGSDRAIS